MFECAGCYSDTRRGEPGSLRLGERFKRFPEAVDFTSEPVVRCQTCRYLLARPLGSFRSHETPNSRDSSFGRRARRVHICPLGGIRLQTPVCAEMLKISGFIPDLRNLTTVPVAVMRPACGPSEAWIGSMIPVSRLHKNRARLCWNEHCFLF